MTLLEAMNTRKYIRRAHWKPGYMIKLEYNGLFHTNQTFPYFCPTHELNGEDIQAINWEIAEFLPEDTYKYAGVDLNGIKLYMKVLK